MKIKFSGSKVDPYRHVMATICGRTHFINIPLFVKDFIVFLWNVKHRNDWNVDFDENGNMLQLPNIGVFKFTAMYVYQSIRVAMCKHEFSDTGESDLESGAYSMTCRKCGYNVSGFMC